MSSKHKLVSISIVEIEYHAFALVAYEVIWLTSILKGLQVKQVQKPILFIDNLSAKDLTTNPVMHARMKHLETDFQFKRDLVVECCLDKRFTPSKDQVVDTLTNPLGELWLLSLKFKLMVFLLLIC